ncbi:matrixin family metalloprotease [Aeoliella mucimassa]|uniref:Matrixin n=1 Tax=Aeoliella mucimassa TaxID=2527972 RepID=A0A518ALA2_9BACT|nr:matrixin family metalloprotease [Aeoliella mucimassa]QDU55522.1 Matrixin [Aeoliella mucimassa]
MNILRAVLLLTLGCCLFAGSRLDAYDLGGRWTRTQSDGNGIERGDPVTLLWSIVPDGSSYDRSDNSDLVQFMDNLWNVPTESRINTFTERSWFAPIQDAYDQYSYVSGISMVYVAEQDERGRSTGQFGDMRIGGEAFDTNPNVNVLADNTYPNGGDMRIDTTPGEQVTGYAAFRNLISHESGHGVGLGHTDPVGAESIMEGGLQTHFFGLQFDDVYGVNRLYGDPREKSGGNDGSATATSLGQFEFSGAISLGTDAIDSVVEQFDDDWLGIDGDTDQDWFTFNTLKPGLANISITPLGPSYHTSDQGDFDATQQSDLTLEIYGPGATLITTINSTGLGGSESAEGVSLSAFDDYYVRVVGDQDANQFYQLDVEVELAEVVVEINRRTGAAAIKSELNERVSIFAYELESQVNALDPSDGAWNSLTDQQVGAFSETSATASMLAEQTQSTGLNLEANGQATIGSPYSPTITEPFGTAHADESMSFSYTIREGREFKDVHGVVNFVGDPLFNNVVLSVDPDTGLAKLTNESNTTIQFNGYSIQSESGSLLADSWESLEKQGIENWAESFTTSETVAEYDSTMLTELAPYEVLELGYLFDVDGVQDLTLSFVMESRRVSHSGDLLFEEVVYELASLPGDYNSDGIVDLADYTLWRDSLGATGLKLAADGNRDFIVDAADYDVWKSQFGQVLDSTGPSEAQVPEPTGVWLLLGIVGLASIACARSR